MDKQRIFDVTVAFLAGQQRQSVAKPDVGCAYRGEENTRCAVGLWISDARYSETFEGKAIGGIGKPCCDLRAALPFDVSPEIGHFLTELQNAHDNCDLFQPRGLGKLMQIAGEHRLDITVLNAVWTGKRTSE